MPKKTHLKITIIRKMEGEKLALSLGYKPVLDVKSPSK
jgi:hypothetical protein